MIILNNFYKKTLSFLKSKYFLLKLICLKKKIYFVVSFPRSGQSPIIDYIKIYCKKFNIDINYCEYYQCCKTLPCTKGANITKSHDYDMVLPLINNHKYLILMRKDKIDQLDSYYRFSQKNENISYDDNNIEFKKFKKFYFDNENYYDSFKKKWLNNNENSSNVKIVFYEDFIENYVDSLIGILKFLELSNNPDRSFISSIVKKNHNYRLELKKRNVGFLKSNFKV